MQLSVRLNRPPAASTSALKDAAQRKQDAATADPLARVSALSYTDKERATFDAFKRAYERGETAAPSKWTKAEVLALGAAVLRKQSAIDRRARIADVLRTQPANYHVLTRDDELPHFIERVRAECRRQIAEWPGRFEALGVRSMTAGDYEGSGIDTYIDVSIGFSIWLPLLDEGYYVPYGHVDVRGAPGCEDLADLPPEAVYKRGDPQLTRSKVISALKPYLSARDHGKTFHMGSARYDLHVAIKDGYEIGGCVWDTLDAMYLLNEHEPQYGLKPLIAKYGPLFGVPGPIYTFEDMFGARSPAPFSVELVGIYAIKDVLYGWRLFEWQFERMQSAPSQGGRGRLYECYAQIDSKLPETDVALARSGFIVDIDAVKRLEAEFTPKLEAARQAVIDAYQIDSAFVRQMDRKINAAKVEAWVEAQAKRVETWETRVSKLRVDIRSDEAAGKTHLVRYKQNCDRLAELERARPAEPTADNAPQLITEFDVSNGNHLAYLIYDHLRIEDRTPQFKRDKTRSTAADVLAAYYEDEEALKPLASVAMYEKLLNTYVRKIPDALEVDGRLHSEYKAGGTATGRYSSSGYSGRPVDILAEFETEG